MEDAVERQGESLQVGLVPQGADGDPGQVVVVQPEVAQLLEAFEAVVWNRADVVRIQAAAGTQEQVSVDPLQEPTHDHANPR